MPFLKANICRIYLENFLTYNKIELHPKPHLNVIIGPNGTGKSSVLCGICIGLGGKPELTGRGKSLVEYIKHGENLSKIEIELYNPDGDNFTIRREFSKSNSSGGRSKWYYQGHEVKEEEIKKLVSRLGIQVSNLCQFLPQDRVIEFAKMDKVQMLQSTEKAVGEIELCKQHEILQSFGKSQQALDTQLVSLNNQLANEENINNKLQSQVKCILDRESLDQNIQELEQVLLFCYYNNAKELFDKMKGQLEKLTSEKLSIEKKMLPYKKDMEQVQKKIKEGNTFLSAKYESLRELDRRNKIHKHNVICEEENIEVSKENYKHSQESASRAENEILGMKKRIAMLETQVGGINEVELGSQIKVLNSSIYEKRSHLESIREEIVGLETEQNKIHYDIRNCDSELRKIRDLKNQKLQILQSRSRGAYMANDWLRSNKDLFRGVIHEPLFILLECSDLDSKYIENVISKQDLIAFVCEDKEDVKTLKLEANKRKWSINILYSHPIDPRTYQPRIPIESLRSFGFEKYLKDTIRAPPSILGFLCRNYNIHNIPIAQRADINRVPQEIGLYFVGNQRFSKKKSRYDQKISTDVSDINSPYFLSQASNSDDEKRLELQLNDLHKQKHSLSVQIAPLEENFKSTEIFLEGLRTEKCEKEKQLNLRGENVSRIDCIRQQLSAREKNRINLDSEKQKMDKSIKDCIKKMIVECQEMSSIENNMNNLDVLCLERSFSLLEHQRKEKDILKSMESDKQLISSKLEEIEKLTNESEKTKDNAKHILSQLLKSLRFQTYRELTNDESVKDRLKQKSTEKSIEEMEREKKEMEVQRSGFDDSDENVLVEYNRREKLIKSLKLQHSKLTEDLKRKVSDIQNVRESWLKNIKLLISRISDLFSSYMTQLGCAGEVQLDTGSNENDFSQYGLSIRVKFRDTEKLKELSAQQQSGGERSVTTALYLLALQQTTTTPVPFRCVDEINQGMDPINERKMFTMLVQSMTQNSASQYFIVSPKLLPNLPYNEYVVFLNIYNWTGRFLPLNTPKILSRLEKKNQDEKKQRRNR